jgi:hypothetical protein
MTDRDRIEYVKKTLHSLKAVAFEQDEQMLCYLLQVAEMEAEDVLSGRFARGSHVEEFAPSALQ